MSGRLSLPDDPKRRSAALAGAALLVFLVVAIAVNALSGGGDDDTQLAPLPAPPAPEVEGVFNDPRVGVIASRPEGWDAERRRNAVRLVSEDESVVVSISSPARAREYEGVLESAVGALQSQYSEVEVGEGDGRTIAGRPTASAVVSATNSKGTDLRVLLAAVRGRREAYLVQVFAAEGAGARRLAEAQTIIGSLDLRK
ncbi:MAG: hypothetical protein WD844_15145 [Thermoleophilaceae bacterium]